jgi:hypothetical protein
MKYAVFEDGKPAVLMHSYDCWKSNVFNTKREAEVYAYLWCVGTTLERAKQEAPEMNLGEDYDYSLYGDPVWMMILEVEE